MFRLIKKYLFLGILLLALILACSNLSPVEDDSPRRVGESTERPDLPTPLAPPETDTTDALQPPEKTPTAAVIPPTEEPLSGLLPPDLSPITAENLSKLVPIGRLGIAPILDIAYSKLGFLVLGTMTGLTVFDTETHEIALAFEESSGILDLAVSVDGQVVAAILENGSIQVYDLRLGEVVTRIEVAFFQGIQSSLYRIDVDKTGNLIAASSSKEGGGVWDLSTGEIVSIFEDWIIATCLQFEPTSNQIVICDASKQTLDIVDPITGMRIRSLDVPGEYILAISILEGEPTAVILTWTTVSTWDLSSGSQISEIPLQNEGVSVAVNENGQIFIGDAEGIIHSYASPGLNLLWWIQAHSESVHGLTYDQSRGRLFSIGRDGHFASLDAVSGELLAKKQLQLLELESIAFSPDGKQLAAGYLGGLNIWDLFSGAIIYDHVYSSGFYQRHEGVSFDPFGGKVAVGVGEEILIFDAVKGELIVTINNSSDEELNYIMGLKFSLDGTLLAAGGPGNVRVWKTEDRTILYAIPTSDLIGRDPEISVDPSGRFLAAASSLDGLFRVVIAEFATGQILAELFGHQSLIVDIAFSSAGDRLASVDSSAVVKIWDTNPWALISEFEISSENTDRINAITFIPRRNILLAGGDDGWLRFWDTQTAELLYELRVENRPEVCESICLKNLELTKDGTLLAVGLSDGTIRLFGIASP